MVGIGVAALLSGGRAAAQICDLELEPALGGVAGAQTDTGFVYVAELAIEIAPDLSYVQLENSEIRVRFSPFSSGSPQFAITDFVIKSADEDQISAGTDFMGAGAGRGPIDSATLIVDREDRKTVRLEWCSASVPAGVPDCSETIVKEVTIFPHQRFIKFDNIDTKFQGNVADLASPGGTDDGEHVITLGFPEDF